MIQRAGVDGGGANAHEERQRKEKGAKVKSREREKVETLTNGSVKKQNKKETKLEEEMENGAMEAEVDEDDGTFTNISLTDDAGKSAMKHSLVE